MPVYLGTSGWQYRHWRGRLYPEGVPQRRWLEHYAERFAVVEVNASFYRLPSRGTVEEWARRTPEDFVMAVKASRYLTHVRRLRDPGPPVARLLDVTEPLGRKLGPVLVQLPPGMRRDAATLAAALDAFPRGVRVAVEPRHPSWDDEEVFEVLRRHDAALCMVDRGGSHPDPVRTASWGYLRMHEGVASPAGCYGEHALDAWAARLGALFAPQDTVFVFFNNDAEGCAPRDAALLAPRLERAGLAPTRVPSLDETPVGAEVRPHGA
ncbi:MAG: DUF72 domain-containing protein [Actinomycetota bacterium]